MKHKINNSLWQPYINLKEFKKFGITITKGDGIYLEDTNGKKYINGFSGLSTVCGLNNGYIIDSINKQAKTLAYCSLFRMNHEPAIELANKLNEITPITLNKVLLTSSASEAVEAAIKISRQYFFIKSLPEKKVILSLNLSYHGNTYGAFSLSGIYSGRNHEIYGPILSDIDFISLPNDIYSMHSNEDIDILIQNTLNKINQNLKKIAAIILEPILGAAGVIPLPKKYLETISLYCQKNNILVIIDESATGFGRTGTMFAIDKMNFIPDMMILGKGMNSGYLPCGALMVSSNIYDAYTINNGYELSHTTSQAGNPLCCAASLASINYIEKEKLVLNTQSMEKVLLKYSNDLLLPLPNIKSIRCFGLMFAIELIDPKTNKELPEKDILDLYNKFLDDGLIVHTKKNRIHFFPPLTITKEEIYQVVLILFKNIK